MSSLETQLSQLTTLVSSLVEQQGVKVESSGFVAAAPGGGGPETSMHLSTLKSPSFRALVLLYCCIDIRTKSNTDECGKFTT